MLVMYRIIATPSAKSPRAKATVKLPRASRRVFTEVPRRPTVMLEQPAAKTYSDGASGGMGDLRVSAGLTLTSTRFQENRGGRPARKLQAAATTPTQLRRPGRKSQLGLKWSRLQSANDIPTSISVDCVANATNKRDGPPCAATSDPSLPTLSPVPGDSE